MFATVFPLAAAFDALVANAGLAAAVAIVAVGAVYGVRDVARFNPVRVWALSSVSFTESIRRRVLWVTPVAILGILAVAQFLDPVDPQDALRQVTKVCLFATGLVVVVTAIILACTSLPKEIDSRVIYTVVTKPTTRLEIVMGKVLGFARVSAVILLIMGAFTLGYLKLREWRTRSWIRGQLAANAVDPQMRPAFQLYADDGLLLTKSMATPLNAQVYARPRVPGGPAVLTGGESQYFTVPFQLTADDKASLRAALEKGGGVFLLSTIGFDSRVPTPEEAKTIRDLRIPTVQLGAEPEQNSILPSLPTLSAIVVPIPQVIVSLYNKALEPLVDKKLINDGNPLNLPPGGGQPRPVPAFLAPEAVEALLAVDQFLVMVETSTITVDYLVGETPVLLAYSPAPSAPPQPIGPMASPTDPTRPAEPLFQSHRGRYGMQIKGKPDGSGPITVFEFRNVEVPAAGGDGRLTLEARIGIESAGDLDNEANITPRMQMEVVNRASGKSSDPMEVRIESNRVVPVSVPADVLAGGNFDVHFRGLNEGAYYGLEASSLSLVRDTQPFSVNLLKGLLVLWLMAVLVVAIAVFTSTFLSWPIAIVLTLFILLGHWGVSQLGDIAGSGLGTEVTQAMGLDDPTAARIVRTSVSALTNILNFVAQFLPDISKFAATEDIERGVSMPAGKLAAAGWVLLGYGLPVTVLSYVILRNKEVAP